MLLQDMWTTGLEWDEEMDESLVKTAQNWFSELQDLKWLQIPRSLQEKTTPVDDISLHTFVDASENAHGAVVYRYTDTDIKMTPCQLMGAVVSVRLTERISTTLDIPISTTVFWADSVNVL